MNVFASSRQLAFVTKLFAAAGLNIQDFIQANDESALRAHLESLKGEEPTAAQAALLTAAGIQIAAEQKPSDALKAHLAGKDSAIEVFTAGLSAAQVKVVAADAKAGVTAADVKAAIDARVSVAASELTATIGTRPIETTVAKGTAYDSKQRTYAEFQAMNPGDKKAFLRSGGEITDAPKLR